MVCAVCPARVAAVRSVECASRGIHAKRLAARRPSSGHAADVISRRNSGPQARLTRSEMVVGSVVIAVCSQNVPLEDPNGQPSVSQQPIYLGARNPTGPGEMQTDSAAVLACTEIDCPAPGSRTKTRFRPGRTDTFTSGPSARAMVKEPSLLAR